MEGFFILMAIVALAGIVVAAKIFFSKQPEQEQILNNERVGLIRQFKIS